MAKEFLHGLPGVATVADDCPRYVLTRAEGKQDISAIHTSFPRDWYERAVYTARPVEFAPSDWVSGVRYTVIDREVWRLRWVDMFAGTGHYELAECVGFAV